MGKVFCSDPAGVMSNGSRQVAGAQEWHPSQVNRSGRKNEEEECSAAFTISNRPGVREAVVRGDRSRLHR